MNARFNFSAKVTTAVHVVARQVDEIVKRANVPRRARFGRTAMVDVALHLERPFFAIPAPPECLGT
jgi:hypothetical protein